MGTAQPSNAQEFQPNSSPLAPRNSSTAQGGTITPAESEADKMPMYYGIVRSSSDSMLNIRTLEGESRQMTIPREITTSASGLRRGDLIGYSMDDAGNLVSIKPPEVEREFKGTVSDIQGDQVTLVSASGESMTTSLDTATIARMGLVPGKPLKVMSYVGTWATKVCCDEVAAAPRAIIRPTPTVPPPMPLPTGGGQPSIRGMW